jgi:hypothetical protein
MDVGLAIIAFVFVFLALALMFMALMFKRPSLAWAAMLPWIVFGFFIKAQLSTADYDIYYWIFWLCVLGLPLLCMTEALILRPKRAEEKQDFYLDEGEQMAKDWEEMSSPGIPRLRSRRRYKKRAENE